MVDAISDVDMGVDLDRDAARRLRGQGLLRLDGLVDDPVHTLQDHLDSISTRLRDCGIQFRDQGMVKLPFLAPELLKRAVAEEIHRAATDYGVRRDLILAQTGGTVRRMRNVDQRDIDAHTTVLPQVYRCAALRAALTAIAGEAVLECPYEPERYVITELTGAGDTHGWHWDDYSFALVWVVDCPPLADGGFVQYVANTTWDKNDPQLHRQFAENPIHSVELHPGDIYLMRTDTTLHRVYPLRAGRRLILNMAYAAESDLTKPVDHQTMDTLWSRHRADAADPTHT